MNILVVDDELDFRLLLGRILNQQGHTVFLGENGKDGLIKMKLAKMDLIITDVYMPLMDGFSLHSAIRKMKVYESIPILFVSAYADDPFRTIVRNPKIDGFHKKERPVEELLAWVEYLSGTRSTPPVMSSPSYRVPQYSVTSN
jgi:two-component system, chemotaxis family, chemotaxis protein CheY